MKFYLIDDDKNVLHILKRIIRDRGLGEIAGTAENGVDAVSYTHLDVYKRQYEQLFICS